jgi:outer membrane lipoprotein-sorting protein
LAIQTPTLAIVLGFAALVPLTAAAQSCDTAKVLAQMDTASARFKSAQADFQWDQLQAVVQEHDIQSGTIYFDRHSSATVMAAHITQENGQNAPKTVTYRGGEVELYQPMLNQETILQAGNNRAQAESFLTLGFGGSGKDLKANWDVSCQAMETVGGAQTAKLALKPKSQSVANMFSQVTIWVDPARAISLKQVFDEPSGDSRTATYSNIRYNSPINPDVVEIHVAPGTQVVRK